MFLFVPLSTGLIFPPFKDSCRLFQKVRGLCELGSLMSECNIMSEATDLEDRFLWLLFFHKEGTVLLTTNSHERLGFQRVWLILGLRWDRDLHPRGGKYGCLCHFISITAFLKRFLPVHCLWIYCDPALILRYDSQHACFINILLFHLISYHNIIRKWRQLTWIFHQPEVVRDLSLIGGFFQDVFTKDFVGFLEVLMFVSWGLQHLLRD